MNAPISAAPELFNKQQLLDLPKYGEPGLRPQIIQQAAAQPYTARRPRKKFLSFFFGAGATDVGAAGSGGAGAGGSDLLRTVSTAFHNKPLDPCFCSRPSREPWLHHRRSGLDASEHRAPGGLGWGRCRPFEPHLPPFHGKLFSVSLCDPVLWGQVSILLGELAQAGDALQQALRRKRPLVVQDVFKLLCLALEQGLCFWSYLGLCNVRGELAQELSSVAKRRSSPLSKYSWSSPLSPRLSAASQPLLRTY